MLTTIGLLSILKTYPQKLFHVQSDLNNQQGPKVGIEKFKELFDITVYN